VDAKRITLTYANLPSVTVNFYEMDLELLFSTSPFITDGSTNKFVYVAPNLSQKVELDNKVAGKTNTLVLDLPAKYANANIFIEVLAPGNALTKGQSYFSNSLSVHVTDNYGQVKVMHKENGAPLPQTYIKVYARLRSGEVSFYKDGYTDRRGRFDYASLSTDKLTQVSKFSILVLSENAGALVREANPPAGVA